jgi:AcrR family transcriptional regulator
MAHTRVTDRRVQKTERLLREALQSLIGEKDLDAIAVQDILDRANVGRSTFYAHFRDKEALLTSSIHEMLGPAPSSSPAGAATPYDRLMWFSLPMFEAIGQHRQRHAGEARKGPRGPALAHEHLRMVLTRLIAGQARRDSPSRQKHRLPPDLVAQHVASTFILVLNWWVDTRSPLTATDVHEVFRMLVEPALSA